MIRQAAGVAAGLLALAAVPTVIQAGGPLWAGGLAILGGGLLLRAIPARAVTR